MSESSGEVTLREITEATVLDVTRLRVAPEQEKFVAANAVSLAQAHFARGVAWFRAIYQDETPVGFVMVEEDPAKPAYFLWRFMIDARWQRRGIGRRALDLVLAHVRTRPGAVALETSCVPGEGGPGPFYERLGFVDTGAVEEGERVLRREL